MPVDTGKMQAFKQALMEDIQRVSGMYIGDLKDPTTLIRLKASLEGAIQAHLTAAGVDPPLLSIESQVETSPLDPRNVLVSLKVKGLLTDQFQAAPFNNPGAVVLPEFDLPRASADPREWPGKPEDKPADWDDWLFPPGPTEKC